MQKLRRLGLIAGGVLVAGGFFWILFGFFKPRMAGIFIETTPSASVLIDGKKVGETPFRTTLEAKEVVVLLIPESFGVSLAPYETKINLTPGVETVVRREFGEAEEAASGEIISFERGEKKETSLVIVTDPDSSQITIDGGDRVFSPYKTSSILPGEHTLVISKEGYLPRVLRVKTHRGFKLTAFVKLGLIKKVNEDATIPSPTPTQEVLLGEVEILETPTGFLRVRETPSSLGKEIGKVVTGEIYPLLQEDEKTGWFKIEFEEGAFGWISNQYARKLKTKKAHQEEISPTFTPTPTI